MKLPPDIPIYGNIKFRGKCPTETAEQITFFNEIRRLWPDTWGVIATHIRNEGKKTAQQVKREKAEGMVTGASDIAIGGWRCELKRQDHTKCKISDEQIAYLSTTIKLGYTACIALGWEAALEAFKEYIDVRNANES